jgi:protein-S-isoprenylcysteine O-methyltransferase Ste14
MRFLRIGLGWLLIAGVGGPAFGGDLQKSIANAAKQQAQQVQSAPIPRNYKVVGGALVIGGAVAAAFGFLHTTSFEQWQPSHVAVGAAGIGAVIVGGLVLLKGQEQAGAAPSLNVSRRRVSVSKRLSW